MSAGTSPPLWAYVCLDLTPSLWRYVCLDLTPSLWRYVCLELTPSLWRYVCLELTPSRALQADTLCPSKMENRERERELLIQLLCNENGLIYKSLFLHCWFT